MAGVRQPLIIRELEQLYSRRKLELSQSSHNQQWQGFTHSETAFDMKIRLLQEELDKLSREEEILNINQYASTSNNPFFMGGEAAVTREASSLYTLRPRSEEDVMQAVLDQELVYPHRRQYVDLGQGGGEGGRKGNSLQTVR